MTGYSATDFADRYDAHMASGLMDRYFSDSGFFNTGYWTAETASVVEASERLVTEVCRPLPKVVQSILDVGCGEGGTTEALQRRFPSALIVAANISLRQLARARDAGRARMMCGMDAGHISVRDGSFDVVIAVEAAMHFESRAQFLSEAARVLRPGGHLVASDILFSDTESVGPWMIPGECLKTIDQYQELFDRTNWADVEIRDATRPCWGGFCDGWDSWIHSLAARGDIDLLTLQSHRDLVERWRSRTVRHYLLVEARRR